MTRFTLFLAALLMAFSASGQVQITKNEHPLQKVSGLTQVSALMLRDSTYYLMFITDNRYDDAIFISLGEGKEEALESLAALDEMMEGVAKDETFYLADIDGEQFLVSRIAMTKYARLTSSTRAGHATLHRVALKRAVQALTQ